MTDLDDLMAMADDMVEAEEIKLVAQDISDIYLIVLCVVGIPGNILTIVSIITMGKISSATILVALLASYDGLALLAKLVGHYVAGEIYVNVSVCRLHFIPYYLSALANWTLAFIAFERFLSVCFPLQKAWLLTRKKTYIIAACQAVVLLLFYLPFFLVTSKVGWSGRSCTVGKDYKAFNAEVWPWLSAIVFLFIPFTVCMTFTVLIIVSLVKSRKVRRSMVYQSDSQSPQSQITDNNRKLIKEAERIERMITAMLILASVLFAVMATPACVYYLLNREADTETGKAKWILFHQITFVFLDSTHALNFFLYFVSTKRFRNHFISLITGKHYRRRGNGGSNPSNASDATKSSTMM